MRRGRRAGSPRSRGIPAGAIDGAQEIHGRRADGKAVRIAVHAKKLLLKAPAKINLYLEVGKLRPDGYHAVRTVMQAVQLYDRLEISLTPEEGEVELLVEGKAPSGSENLCHRAASLFLERTGLRKGVRVVLTKLIPEAAGLGGGSSDAAAVLRGLNHLGGDILESGELFRLASSLGSDVPFFLLGGTVLAEGRGERVRPLAQAPPLPVVLVNPGVGLRTAEVYRRFDLEGGDPPPPSGMELLLEALSRGEVDRVSRFLFNSLQRVACRMMPELLDLLEKGRRAGALGGLVSGSGPTVFFLTSGESEAESLAAEMSREAPFALKTGFCSHGVAVEERG